MGRSWQDSMPMKMETFLISPVGERLRKMLMCREFMMLPVTFRLLERCMAMPAAQAKRFQLLHMRQSRRDPQPDASPAWKLQRWERKFTRVCVHMQLHARVGHPLTCRCTLANK